MPNKIADASLIPELASRSYKFTSQRGRNRRTRLLSSALDLLREKPMSEITMAMVCELAEIPRSSAYHFFPSVDAIFLGIRMYHGERLIERIKQLHQEKFGSWQEYAERFIDTAVAISRSEPGFLSLIYGFGPLISGARELSLELDSKLASLSLEGFEHHFSIPIEEGDTEIFSIAFGIVDGLFRYSYRRSGTLQDEIISESKKAAIAYLSTYLKETAD